MPVVPMPGPDEGRAAVRPRRPIDRWGPYLVLAVALAPVVVPTGPAELAILDAFNVIALVAFTVQFLTGRVELKLPFAAGALAITVGSLIAIVNAENVPAAMLALSQDAYLYLWFILLVSVMSVRGDLVGLRIAWVVVGCAEAFIAFALLAQRGVMSFGAMAGPKGARALGTFYDPNMCADYLGMSLFILLTLEGHVSRVLRWAAAAILFAAIVATKSNGGALSLVSGLAVWGLVRARTARIPMPAVAGMVLVFGSLFAAGAWMSSSLGIGTHALQSLTSHSFVARAEHSSQGRFKIWRQLEASLRKAPLGIGPGNSRWMPVTVEGRERPHSMYSKEAHSDYLAYAIERGPLAALALLALVVQAFFMVRRVWLRRSRGGRGDNKAGALVAGLAGALTCSVVHSLTLERLHFRHFWLLLALIAALAEAARRPRTHSVPAPARANQGAAESFAAASA
jgi:O-antigen ligase